MQSPHSFSLNKSHRVCVQQLQLLCLIFFIVLSLLVSCCSSSACSSCSESSCPETSGCIHGILKDECNCCDVCALGPGELCGGIFNYGTCAGGLECVKPAGADWQQPGTCQVIPTTPPTVSSTTRAATTSSTSESFSSTTTEDSVETTRAATTSSTSESFPSTTTEDSVETTRAATTSSTSESFPSTTTEDSVELNCRTPCSPHYCTGKARVCSARGLEDMKKPSRNACQHTSCHACFLLLGPAECNSRCGELPSKPCLRDFYKCVRDHYLQPDATSFILKLDDPRALVVASKGRVICHVPSLLS